MKINKKTIDKIEDTIKIKLTCDEIKEITKSINSIKDYSRNLNQIDFENIEPTYRVFNLNTVLREDEVKSSLSREEVFKNTLNKEDNSFKIKC